MGYDADSNPLDDAHLTITGPSAERIAAVVGEMLEAHVPGTTWRRSGDEVRWRLPGRPPMRLCDAIPVWLDHLGAAEASIQTAVGDGPLLPGFAGWFRPVRLGQAFEVHAAEGAGVGVAGRARRRRLFIEVGAGFGSGQHPSTQAASALLGSAVCAAGPRIQDIGCGTGVLSLQLAHLSLAAHGSAALTAIDRDARAVAALRRHLLDARNGVTAGAVDARVGDAAGLAQPVDLVVANLPFVGWQQLAGALLAQGPSGVVIAGFEAAQEARARALAPRLALAGRALVQGWPALWLRAPVSSTFGP